MVLLSITPAHLVSEIKDTSTISQQSAICVEPSRVSTQGAVKKSGAAMGSDSIEQLKSGAARLRLLSGFAM